MHSKKDVPPPEVAFHVATLRRVDRIAWPLEYSQGSFSSYLVTNFLHLDAPAWVEAVQIEAAVGIKGPTARHHLPQPLSRH